MRRPFVITAAAAAIPADGRGRGRLAVTVSNTTARPITAHARVVPGDAASDGWVGIAGEPIFDLPPQGTRQLELLLAPPVGATPGAYACHLAVWDEADPDEDYVDGPAIAFVIPAGGPKARRRFPWWLLWSVLGILVLAALPWVWATLVTDGWTRRVQVPPITGLPSAQAAAALEPDLRFGQVTILQQSDQPLGTIVAQDPAPGAVLATGQTVAVVVHGGLQVPNLVGTWVDKARMVIANTGLTVGQISTAVEAADLPLGSVLRQDPKPDVQVPAGTAVNVVVLEGVQLQDLRKTTLPFTETAMRTLGLTLQVAPGDTTAEGIEKPMVTAQDPAPGTMMHLGGTVTVQVVYPAPKREAGK